MSSAQYYGVCMCVFVCVGRYAYPSDPPPGHTSHAGQRAGTVLLCLLHLRHRWRAAVGGATEEPLFHGRGRQDVSYYSNRQMSQQWDALTSLLSKVCSPLISLFHPAIISKRGSISQIV